VNAGTHVKGIFVQGNNRGTIQRKYKHNKHKNINKSAGEHTFPQKTGARSAASKGSTLKIVL
jgi:hypothetical protein